jgi:hypothetical protein
MIKPNLVFLLFIIKNLKDSTSAVGYNNFDVPQY